MKKLNNKPFHYLVSKSREIPPSLIICNVRYALKKNPDALCIYDTSIQNGTHVWQILNATQVISLAINCENYT